MNSTRILRRLVTVLTLCLVAAVPPRRSVVAHPDIDARLQRIILNERSTTVVPDHLVSLQQATDLPAGGHRHASPSKGYSNKTIFVMSMAFLTGCVDTVCYRRYKCYVNMMTGNIIRFATAMAESRWMDAMFHISLVASYVVGAGVFRAIDLHLRDEKKETKESHHLLVVVAPLIVTLFALADVVAHFVVNERIHAPLLSFGFGIMNAASADATGGTIVYAMTGHITRSGRSLADYWLLASKRQKALKSLKSHLRIVTCFAAGIALSVKAAQYISPLTSIGRPPMATTAGLLFASLFVWYGTVPVKSYSSPPPPIII